MKAPGGILSEIEMRDWTGEVDWLALWPKQALATEILNGEPKMVQNLLRKALATKIETRLRKQSIDGFRRIWRVLGFMQEREEPKNQVSGYWEVAGQIW